jgi:hypothetical protein
MEWAGHVASLRTMRNAHIFVGKPEGKRPFGRPRRRWQDNNRLDLREIEWEDVVWMYLVQDRDQWWAVVNMAMNIRFS